MSYIGSCYIPVKPDLTEEAIERFIEAAEGETDYFHNEEEETLFFHFDGDATVVDAALNAFAEEWSTTGFVVEFDYEGDRDYDFFGPTQEAADAAEITWRREQIAEHQQRIEQLGG